MESIPDTNALPVMRNATSRSVTEAFQIFVSQKAVERAIHEWLAELYIIYDVAIRTISLPAFTVPVVEFAKSEAEKKSVEKANLDNYQSYSNKAILCIRQRWKTSSRHVSWTRQDLRVSRRTYPTIRRRVRRRKVLLRLCTSRISIVMIAVAAKNEEVSNEIAVVIASLHSRLTSETLPKVASKSWYW